MQEDAAKLLLFESSHLESGKKITLSDYMARATEDRNIFYLAAPRLVRCHNIEINEENGVLRILQPNFGRIFPLLRVPQEETAGGLVLL